MVTDVSSTFPRSRISDLVTYTGKQKTLTAVLTAGKDEKGNDIELPVGKTKIKWTTKDKTVAGVSGKKEAGTVKPVNGLKKKDNQAGDTKDVIIEVTAEGRNTKKEPYTFSGSYTLTVEQSNISLSLIHISEPTRPST